MAAYNFSKLINTEELQAHSLRDCSVVIDGQNYLHNLYQWSEIPFVFGCETDKYAEHLRKHFEMFKQANVKCYIIFKGGDSDIEKKIKKFQNLVFDVRRTKIAFIPPVLLKDTNVQVVAEMGIDYTFCVTEAKEECVSLAVKLECPVISRDKEFCFKKAPYIPSNTMKYDARTKSIQCRQFRLEDFLQRNSLTEGKYAIFAALTDTTVFPVRFFSTLCYAWQVSHGNKIDLRNLIVWLSKHSEEEATSDILKRLTSESVLKFWSKYFKILKNMANTKPGHATEYLLNSNLPIMTQDPEWFEKGVVCKHVPPVYVNLYKSKAIEGSWLILDTHSQDSVLLSIDIVKYAYNLLTNYSGGQFKVYQDDNKYIEIMPDEMNVRRPIYNCEVSVFENGWGEVKDLKLFEHFLTEKSINTEFLAKLEPDCVLLFAALVYFARMKQLEGEDVTREVYAVVLSYVLLNLEFNTRSMDGQDHLNTLAAKYFQYNEDEARRIFDGTVLHRFVEIQSCIQHMNYLNTLCGSPYESTQYRKSYNGTLIYKMFYEMRDRDVGEFVNELLFETNLKVLGKVKRLISIYRILFNSE